MKQSTKPCCTLNIKTNKINKNFTICYRYRNILPVRWKFTLHSCNLYLNRVLTPKTIAIGTRTLCIHVLAQEFIITITTNCGVRVLQQWRCYCASKLYEFEGALSALSPLA